MVTTVDGWVKPHVLDVWKLVILVSTIQQGQRHPIISSTKENAKWMLNISEDRWTKHGRGEMEVAH